METIRNRYDFIYLFDVEDGNPNGDPDAGNMPRIDAATGEGLVTDVCLKRKVRNYVQIAKNGVEHYDVLVKSEEFSGQRTFINGEIEKAYKEINIDLNSENDIDGKKRSTKNKGKGQGSEITRAREYMCNKFYDVRTFGGVLSTGPNAGQVRGPVQLTFARSVSPIMPSQHAITICAARDTGKDYESQVGIQGRKFTVPYGLYLTHGFVSSNLARQTGFSEEDLNLFWDALKNMFDVDHSAARGMMSPRRLIVFRHESELGNTPSYQLFDRVHVIQKDPSTAPRSYADYEVTVDSDNLPKGIELLDLI